jgi:hypothetical protein
MSAVTRGSRVSEQVWGRVLGLGAMILLLGLAACHTETPSAPTPTPSSAPTPSPSPAGPTAELTIVVDLGHGGSDTTWRLTCSPAGGNHPDPVGACQALEVNGAAALPPVPKDRACTMIYGGPEHATVTGTWNGQKVSSSFSRTNGCEINRWAQMVPLLPEATS